jgi:opacity protein-like surface antigen
MKKILLLAFCASMFASTTTSAQNLKQSGGEKNLQVLFAPLGGSPISINGITYRKFNATGNRAWRVNLFIGLNNETEVISQEDTGMHVGTGTTTKPQMDKKTSEMTFSIKPGYEWHMAGTERLSPYCGVELLFSLTTAKTEEDTAVSNQSGTTAGTDWKLLTLETTGDGANTTIGLNLVAGVDYYIAKNLSLGAELGFGFSMTSHPDIEGQHLDLQSTTDNTIVVMDSPAQVQGKTMQVGPNVVGQIKLGWLF